MVAHPLTGAMKSVRNLGAEMKAAEARIFRTRIQQGRESVSASNVSLGEAERVVAAFKTACRPENEKRRRVLMEERVKAAISRGGAGTVSSNESTKETKLDAIERNSYGEAQSGPALRSISVEEPVELTEEEEAAFAQQLEKAKAASLAIDRAKGEGDPNENRAAGTEEEEFERQLRTAMEISLAEQRGYERGMLQAAAQWREGDEPSPQPQRE